MGNARLLSNNLITAASMITPSSNATGLVTNVQKEGSGSGSVVVQGDYSGTSDLDYLLQIDAAGTGEVGSSTYKWSEDGGSTFVATGVLTSGVAAALDNGLSVIWTGGSGVDFVLNDVFRFKAYRPYGASKLIDPDRDTEWRSASDVTAAINVVVDLTAAQVPTVLALLDHNFSSAATIVLQASYAADFSSIDYTRTLTWRTGTILYYLTNPPNFRYWRVRVTDTANTDGYLRMSGLYLGTYSQMTMSFELGEVRTKRRLSTREQLASGKWVGGLNAVINEFDLSWIHLTATDKDLLVAAFDATNDSTNRLVKPLMFNSDADDVSLLYVCEWDGEVRVTSETQSPGLFQVPVRLVETVRTV